MLQERAEPVFSGTPETELTPDDIEGAEKLELQDISGDTQDVREKRMAEIKAALKGLRDALQGALSRDDNTFEQLYAQASGLYGEARRLAPRMSRSADEFLKPAFIQSLLALRRDRKLIQEIRNRSGQKS